MSGGPRDRFDLVLVGGGLQNGLIVLSALAAAPECRIALVEAEPRLGGNHTWCVHARDVSPAARRWFEPLIVQRWHGYDVRFPGFSRALDSAYAVVSSERFAHVVSERIASSPGQLLLGRRAQRIEADRVQLDDGSVLHGRLVIDARGPDPQAHVGRCGYQKFLGLELALRERHGLSRPLLMDATCEQRDGFRFFYVLPLTPDRLLVEETRFSRTPGLDRPAARREVYAYATRFGAIAACVREEVGVLPMPWSMRWPEADVTAGALPAGYRGGYFHPATGYSMPAALRVAELVGEHVMLEPLGPAWQRFVRTHRAQAAYALQLNRLLFTGFAETDMWGVLARFYHLPEIAIERFYALESSLLDRARIVVGRPPRGFSLRRAIAEHLPGGGAA
ncbi:MAG: lycopene beta-cyclase CrtY [Polyangiales bacterium]